MRTINEKLFHRLTAQAQEAEIQGFDKVADALTDQVDKYGSLVRKDTAFYSYNENEFKKDINYQLWNAILRMADFYNVQSFDALQIQNLIEKTSEDLLKNFCIKAGINHGVGAYEEVVPGEIKEVFDFEVIEGE